MKTRSGLASKKMNSKGTVRSVNSEKSLKKRKSSVKVIRPIKADDIPVTQRMFEDFRKEIKSDNTSTRLQIKSVEKKLLGEVSKLDSRILGLDSKIHTLDSRIYSLESKVETVISEIHRLAFLIEEQNRRNAIVLDGYGV